MKTLTPPVTDWAFCHTCRKKHGVRALSDEHRADAFMDWREKHAGHKIGFRAVQQFASFEDYAPNANVNEAFSTENVMTTTNLQSLATSATAGWGSNVVDNTANLYMDALVQVVIPAVNTAPGSTQAIYVFAYGGSNATDLTTTGSSGGTVGSEGALTFPDVTSFVSLMPLIGVVVYQVQNKLLVSALFSVARGFGGILPPYWGVAIVNNSGMTLAGSANTVKWRGVTGTVV